MPTCNPSEISRPFSELRIPAVASSRSRRRCRDSPFKKLHGKKWNSIVFTDLIDVTILSCSMAAVASASLRNLAWIQNLLQRLASSPSVPPVCVVPDPLHDKRRPFHHCRVLHERYIRQSSDFAWLLSRSKKRSQGLVLSIVCWLSNFFQRLPDRAHDRLLLPGPGAFFFSSFERWINVRPF